MYQMEFGLVGVPVVGITLPKEICRCSLMIQAGNSRDTFHCGSRIYYSDRCSITWQGLRV